MKKQLTTVIVSLTLAALQAQAMAQPQPAAAAGALPQCLADSTTGKDRKDLARWIFFSIAAHPDMKPHILASAQPVAEDTNKLAAGIFTRLLTESCLAPTQAAYKQGGPMAIQSAFETLGRLAMQELTSNPDVSANMGKFESYIDRDKMNKAFNAGKP